MKKFLAILLTLTMIFTLAACGNDNKEKLDSEKVIANGKLIVGVTDYPPMDYQDENGNWIGFDADMAVLFAKSLGITAEFIEIDWDNKEFELDSGSIDAVWNGMTLTDEVIAAMETSKAYCENQQVVVINDALKFSYNGQEDLANGKFSCVAEIGSAGAGCLADAGANFVEAQNQANALMEVAAGTSTLAVVDYQIAAKLCGEGNAYADLKIVDSLVDEKFGVGFRKGSDLAAKLDAFFAESYKSGQMMQIAEIYGIDSTIIPQ